MQDDSLEFNRPVEMEPRAMHFLKQVSVSSWIAVAERSVSWVKRKGEGCMIEELRKVRLDWVVGLVYDACTDRMVVQGLGHTMCFGMRCADIVQGSARRASSKVNR